MEVRFLPASLSGETRKVGLIRIEEEKETIIYFRVLRSGTNQGRNTIRVIKKPVLELSLSGVPQDHNSGV